jgi:hypothetical protein
MAKSHNKRRNVGLIYEMLLREASLALINDDQKRSERIVRLIKHHFRKGTQLQKEYRLFNALLKTNVPSDVVALKILDEAKTFSRKIDQKQLYDEKTSLIHSINHTIGKTVYERKIPNYRMYATVQTLLNDWRLLEEANFERVIDFESKVRDWLVREKKENEVDQKEIEKTDRLVVKIMTEKLNERYRNNLNEEQKEIVKNYAFYMSDEKIEEMRSYLSDLREETIKTIKSYLQEEGSVYLDRKAEKVLEDINNLNLNEINDELIGKMLTISHLKQTIVEN